jgi:hypothetical protein
MGFSTFEAFLSLVLKLPNLNFKLKKCGNFGGEKPCTIRMTLNLIHICYTLKLTVILQSHFDSNVTVL